MMLIMWLLWRLFGRIWHLLHHLGEFCIFWDKVIYKCLAEVISLKQYTFCNCSCLMTTLVCFLMLTYLRHDGTQLKMELAQISMSLKLCTYTFKTLPVLCLINLRLTFRSIESLRSMTKLVVFIKISTHDRLNLIWINLLI